MRRLILTTSTLLVLLAIAAGVAVVWVWSAYTRPGPLPVEKAVVVSKGLGISAIARELQRKGVVASARVFRIGVRLWDSQLPLRAGEFKFPAKVSAREAATILQTGKTVVRRLTLPEGRTVEEAVAQLRATDGLTGKIAHMPEEGSLLPETYHFSYGDTREGMIHRMSKAMTDTLDRLWPERDSNIPITTKEQALIIASMVEKETAVPEERPMIAAVFLNRLKRGMRMQSDPTVLYGLTHGDGSLGRPLTKADLEKPTPYNTYIIKGLPPTPIANPGRASIEAVLNPAKTKALYFVADGTGGHAFADTLAQHDRNVQKWRKIEHQRELEKEQKQQAAQ